MNNAEIETQVQTAARLFQAGDIARADSLLSTVTQQADNHSGAWLLLARVKQKAGQRQAAVDAFQQLLRLNPGMEEAVLALVQHHGEKQEFDQCEQLLRDAIDARPDIARYPYMLGNLYLQQGYHANGIEQMKKAMSIAPDNLQIQVALAEMHGRHGDLDAALDVMQPLLEMNPPHFPAVIVFANICYSLNMADECMVLINRLGQQPLPPEQAQQLASVKSMLESIAI